MNKWEKPHQTTKSTDNNSLQLEGEKSNKTAQQIKALSKSNNLNHTQKPEWRDSLTPKNFTLTSACIHAMAHIYTHYIQVYTHTT